MSELYTPYQAGSLKLKNRMAMAPMTRSRASRAGVQSDLAIEHYSQRASAGLIITEGSQVSARGVGYIKSDTLAGYRIRTFTTANFPWRPRLLRSRERRIRLRE